MSGGVRERRSARVAAAPDGGGARRRRRKRWGSSLALHALTVSFDSSHTHTHTCCGPTSFAKREKQPHCLTPYRGRRRRTGERERAQNANLQSPAPSPGPPRRGARARKQQRADGCGEDRQGRARKGPGGALASGRAKKRRGETDSFLSFSHRPFSPRILGSGQRSAGPFGPGAIPGRRRSHRRLRFVERSRGRRKEDVGGSIERGLCPLSLSVSCSLLAVPLAPGSGRRCRAQGPDLQPWAQPPGAAAPEREREQGRRRRRPARPDADADTPDGAKHCRPWLTHAHAHPHPSTHTHTHTNRAPSAGFSQQRRQPRRKRERDTQSGSARPTRSSKDGPVPGGRRHRAAAGRAQWQAGQAGPAAGGGDPAPLLDGQ